jgi:hypothetical protein
MHKLIFSLVPVAFLLEACTASAPAYAQGQNPLCGPHGRISSEIYRLFGEIPLGHGPAARYNPQNPSEPIEGNVTELFVNPNNGSWTTVITGRNGMSCILASGFGWKFEPYQPVEERRS